MQRASGFGEICDFNIFPMLSQHMHLTLEQENHPAILKDSLRHGSLGCVARLTDRALSSKNHRQLLDLTPFEP